MFGDPVISDDGKELEGVQDRVCIGAHKRCARVRAHQPSTTKHTGRKKHEPKYLVEDGHHCNSEQVTCVAFIRLRSTVFNTGSPRSRNEACGDPRTLSISFFFVGAFLGADNLRTSSALR